MGMFDSVYFTSNYLTCKEGHEFKDELQTKSLACQMDEYYVHDYTLYQRVREKATRLEPKCDGSKLIHLTREISTFVPFTGTIYVYDFCRQCDPVLFESDEAMAWSRDRVAEKFCHYSWNLVFRDGSLTSYAPVDAESREEVRAKMIKQGIENVLPDDDRVAKKHLELLRKERNKSNEP